MIKIKLNNEKKSHKNMVNMSKTKKSVAFFEANAGHGNLCKKFTCAQRVWHGNSDNENSLVPFRVWLEEEVIQREEIF